MICQQIRSVANPQAVGTYALYRSTTHLMDPSANTTAITTTASHDARL